LGGGPPRIPCFENLSLEELTVIRLLLHWILNALALLVVAHFVTGFEVKNFVSALIAVVVIGLFNATLGCF
jgi:putative membrane protein